MGYRQRPGPFEKFPVFAGTSQRPSVSKVPKGLARPLNRETFPGAHIYPSSFNQIQVRKFYCLSHQGLRLAKVNTPYPYIDALVGDILNYANDNWDSESNSIAPADAQSITVNNDGTTLTATETVGWDSREWKYSTTSGSGYQSFSTPETGKTYTPNFSSTGTFYVVCETTLRKHSY